jgi:MFS family permease
MPVKSYLRFAAGHRRLLAFGFALTFASSVGQTFFIAVFGPSIQREFALSHGQWGAIYMAGTLLSAALLPWTGALIDRLPLWRYTALVVAALVGAAVFMALVPAAGFLIVAVFLLRQTGQGLASHTGTTTTARHFGAHRGKAVALVSLGYAVGETVLPLLAVLAIAAVGWRATYGGAALILAIALPPILWALLRGSGHLGSPRSSSVGVDGGDELAGSWTRREVLRDARFYLLLPAVLAPSFIGTALFFHHLTLAEIKDWSAAWLTGSYWVYALGSVLATLAAGPLIDRVTALRVLPGFLLPLAVGLLVIWAFDDPLWVWPYLFLIGLTSGVAYTAVTALWAEVYGLRHLGAIRSLAVALSVFASALGPAVMGALMDGGVSVETICLFFALYCLMASLLLLVGLKSMARRPLRELP